MSDRDQAGFSRRSLIKRGVIVGSAVWATPVVTSFTSPAGAQTGDTGTCIPCLAVTAGQPTGQKCNINDPTAAQNFCDCLTAGNPLLVCIIGLPPGSTTCQPCGGASQPACACP